MINNIWILIGKKLSGNATAEELLELEELLREDGITDMYSISLLEEIWKNQYQEKSSSNLEQKWSAFEAKLDVAEKNEIVTTGQEAPHTNTSSKGRIIKFFKFSVWVAASALLVILWIAKVQKVENNGNNVILAPKNGISKVQLPDGTKVWLNSGSKLVYNTDYGVEFRKVSLAGEAFFDVVKDAHHPFILTTSTISIRVLGTAFNVRAYNKDKTSETSLVRGRIELTVLKNPEKKIILKASEKLTIINKEQEAAKGIVSESTTEEVPLIALGRIHQAKKDTLPSEALWMEDKFAFDAESFENLAERLERRYNVSIVFKNEETQKLRFTGRFQNESIERALRALQASAYFHFKNDNNKIIIY
ncbi:FecR family protein [Mucilaginibacter sp. BT774]|uniref:FecR family protein n=1 Tax=Mucilaginibacter sp. BT774 TaxID=3062276 RepID=UPI002676A41A|nr:FecR domain-containing protein [Mucilaginibacter sp. BT774]MDO3626204.1 DUF4974 domain-containing protein [Mucilaginibacter sp. BT774]